MGQNIRINNHGPHRLDLDLCLCARSLVLTLHDALHLLVLVCQHLPRCKPLRYLKELAQKPLRHGYRLYVQHSLCLDALTHHRASFLPQHPWQGPRPLSLPPYPQTLRRHQVQACASLSDYYIHHYLADRSPHWDLFHGSPAAFRLAQVQPRCHLV